MKHNLLLRRLGWFAFAALVGGCQAQPSSTVEQNSAAAATAAVAANKAACQRFYDQALNQSDTTAVDSLVAADAVEHQQMPPGYPSGTTAAIKKFIAEWHVAFPDMKITVEKMVAEGDHVAIYSTMTGTNTGPFMGMKPTGKSIKIEGFDLVRISGGKMVEHWGLNDNYAMMLQLGAIKEPAMK
jgi:steroid delta-isomerase-like uncharacterized protein